MAENLNYETDGGKCYGEGGQVYVYDDNSNSSSYISLSTAEVQANCTKYGKLYDWKTVMIFPDKCNTTSSASDTDCAIKTPHQGICPDGWHIPSNEDWVELLLYVDSENGGDGYLSPPYPYYSKTAGKYLKTTSGWDEYKKYEYIDGIGSTFIGIQSGNGTDAYGFKALPGGHGSFYSGKFTFGNGGSAGHWWNAAELGSGSATAATIQYISSSYEGVSIDDGNSKAMMRSVRCVKN